MNLIDLTLKVSCTELIAQEFEGVLLGSKMFMLFLGLLPNGSIVAFQSNQPDIKFVNGDSDDV